MWIAVLPGIAVGVYQVYAMQRYVRGLGQRQLLEQKKLPPDAPEWSEYRKGSKQRILLAMLNVALVLGLLFGLGAWGAAALMWGAGGLCATMIILTLILFVKQM